MRFRESDVAGTAHVQGTHRLRNGAFDSCTFIIAFFEVRSCLPNPCRLNGEMCLTWMERELAWPSCTARTLSTDSACQAVGFGELNLNGLLVTWPMFWFPMATDLSLGASHRLRLPINEEVIQPKRPLLLRLPTLIRTPVPTGTSSPGGCEPPPPLDDLTTLPETA